MLYGDSLLFIIAVNTLQLAKHLASFKEARPIAMVSCKLTMSELNNLPLVKTTCIFYNE